MDDDDIIIGDFEEDYYVAGAKPYIMDGYYPSASNRGYYE